MDGIRRRAREALREMRIAIDTLQPHGSDLAAVLGSLRERLDGLIAGSGIRLVWRVDELPQVHELRPSEAFSLQRVVLEAAGNALRHSGATELRFVAQTRDGGDIEIRVEDNGRGFDPLRTQAGTGATDMRQRAQRMGARFDIASSPGRGTVVRLAFPREAPSSITGRAEVTAIEPLRHDGDYAYLTP